MKARNWRRHARRKSQARDRRANLDREFDRQGRALRAFIEEARQAGAVTVSLYDACASGFRLMWSAATPLGHFSDAASIRALREGDR